MAASVRGRKRVRAGEPVTWYFWVWGGLSCLTLLLALVAGTLGIEYLVQVRRRPNAMINELNSQIASLEKRVKAREDKIATLKKDIEELRKEANEFGRISP